MREYERKLYGNSTPPEYSFPDGGIQVIEVTEDIFVKFNKDKVSWIDSTNELQPS